MTDIIHPCALARVPLDTPVLLALSGGADSSALLDALCEMGVRLSAAHVNHCIRGDEADRDEEFCKNLCRERGVELFLLREDVPARAKESGESVEEAARRIRYAFFERVMSERGIPVLATAHNADDNAETVLLNLVRGSGSRGACGIPRTRELSCGTLVRPILSVSRDQIERYCAERSLSYVTDSTNLSDDYARNRIRHKVLPELKGLNSDFLGAVSRFCAVIGEDCDHLDTAARELLKCGAPSAELLISQPRPIASRALLFFLRERGARPEARHVEALLDAAKNKKRGGVSLPGGVTAFFEGGVLTVKKDDRRKKSEKAPQSDR